MTAPDEEVRVALRDLYPPAESGTVAVDVWERVAAGDTGTPGRRGDGFGGGLLAWLPFIAGPLLVGLLAGALGLTGMFGTPAPAPPGPGAVTAAGMAATRTTAASDCPEGAPVFALLEGSRVLAVSRTDDGAWLAVRDPRVPSRTGWVPAAALVPDNSASVSSLVVGGCSRVAAATPTPGPPEATSEPEPAPEPGAGPSGPAPDTTAPVLAGPSVTYSPAVGYVCTEQSGSVATVSVTASDVVGVASVQATWNGSDAGSAALTRSGTTWSYPYHPDNLSITEAITFTLVGRDAAGNASAPVQVVVQRDQCPG